MIYVNQTKKRKNKNVFSAVQLNFPVIPKKIEKICTKDLKNSKDKITHFSQPKFIVPLNKTQKSNIKKKYTDRILKIADKKFVTLHNPRYEASREVQVWIKKNVVNSWIDCGTSASTRKSKKSKVLGIHVGLTRAYAMLYLFKKGGKKVITNFYQYKNKPRCYGLGKLPPTDYSKCKLIESFYFEEKKWYLINESILHDVQGITGKRIALQISFGKKLPKNLLQQIPLDNQP
jgi:hypothetical protein